MYQNNRFLSKIFIGDEACFSMDGTINTCNVRMYAPKGDKLGLTFQRNNLPQKVAVWGPVDTGRKLNVHKTFRRRPERLLNVLCTFNLRPVSMGECVAMVFY